MSRLIEKEHRPVTGRVARWIFVRLLVLAVFGGVGGCAGGPASLEDSFESIAERFDRDKPGNSAETALQRIERQYRSGDLESAFKNAQKLRRQDPYSIPARRWEAVIAERLGHRKESLQAWSAVAALQPDSATTQFEVGQRLIALGDASNGVRMLKWAVENDLNNVKYRLALAEGHIAANNEALAVVSLIQAHRHLPHEVELAKEIAQLYEKQENFDRAAHYYGVALKLAPKDPVLLSRRGRLNYRLEKFDEALRDFKACEAQMIADQQWDGILEYGQLCLIRGDEETARRLAAAMRGQTGESTEGFQKFAAAVARLPKPQTPQPLPAVVKPTALAEKTPQPVTPVVSAEESAVESLILPDLEDEDLIDLAAAEQPGEEIPQPLFAPVEPSPIVLIPSAPAAPDVSEAEPVEELQTSVKTDLVKQDQLIEQPAAEQPSLQPLMASIKPSLLVRQRPFVATSAAPVVPMKSPQMTIVIKPKQTSRGKHVDARRRSLLQPRVVLSPTRPSMLAHNPPYASSNAVGSSEPRKHRTRTLAKPATRSQIQQVSAEMPAPRTLGALLAPVRPSLLIHNRPYPADDAVPSAETNEGDHPEPLVEIPSEMSSNEAEEESALWDFTTDTTPTQGPLLSAPPEDEPAEERQPEVEPRRTIFFPDTEWRANKPLPPERQTEDGWMPLPASTP